MFHIAYRLVKTLVVMLVTMYNNVSLLVNKIVEYEFFFVTGAENENELFLYSFRCCFVSSEVSVNIASDYVWKRKMKNICGMKLVNIICG